MKDKKLPALVGATGFSATPIKFHSVLVIEVFKVIEPVGLTGFVDLQKSSYVPPPPISVVFAPALAEFILKHHPNAYALFTALVVIDKLGVAEVPELVVATLYGIAACKPLIDTTEPSRVPPPVIANVCVPETALFGKIHKERNLPAVTLFTAEPI
jgi:hypothetical protein